MNGKELVKLLEQNGWTLERIHGSHYIMVKENRTEIVPVHGAKELAHGLSEKILKRTGLK